MIDLFMKQKMFSFKDAFHIYDRDEQEKFKVEGRFFSLGDSLQMTDSSGKSLVSIEQKVMSFLPRYEISIGNELVCEVTKKVTFFKPKFEISKLSWEIDGDLWKNEFQITDGENVRMSVSKKWLSWGDSYHLQIANEEDVLICTAIAIVLDMVLYEDKDDHIF
ncbi:LURP-one-related/scramblase family protein [Bacillus mexicanus]|uniref:LURP-one-related/scramblase family protein n=1 Tax=Bacillus mexicanus TaxID=2834415 RepID=UPI003D1AFAF7